MTKKELLKYLESFGDEQEVFVAIFFKGEKSIGCEISDIESVCPNGGAQINVSCTAWNS
jgi:hypothetical protein